ncbi:MAG: 3-oxoacyl-(acyl-carrier-protein) synthase 2 [Cyanobacteria bacterium RYN_339]|nr:3-oxoacyl-(acyl-carrier-protein) synthase 2 [Cyanobacteria bacterium RYN_339]
MTRRVVVTGMGVASPIGVGLPALLEGLRTARSGTRLIRNFASATFPNRLGGEIDDADLAGAALTADERQYLAKDRKALLAAIATLEAIQDAGESVFAHTTPFQRALSFGPGENPDCLRSLANARETPYQMPFDGAAVWAAGKYHLAGPRAVNIGACAAGAMAIGEAFRLVRAGVVPVAVTGGHDAIASPLGVMGFSILGALGSHHDEPTRASRPFDVTRNGFVPGEGAGILVLEDLEHALARGARIHGEILGYGASLDAYRPTAPEPSGRGACLAMRGALRMAGWAPEVVQYVNAHGTSTPLNDKTETLAIKQVLGAHAYQIPVSSTKSQIGHLVAGAGAVELIGSLLAMAAGFVPATINLTHPDPDCDLDYVPGVVRALDYDRFLSNSFAFGGQNACIAAARYQA